ncbi:MAG: metalloregulator ArsR/SmtB family transcription factor [Patescibacteria group bacterium]|nr:metalloregulator ArsR/SmtB family transcription factor [Patescibacteria group bacterium]
MSPTIFNALAEPNRLKIVEVLRGRPSSVNEVSLLLKLRQPQTSKHLHVLAEAGLVSVKPVAQQRIYSLKAEPFIQLEDWVGSFHQYWNQRLDNLERHLKKG